MIKGFFRFIKNIIIWGIFSITILFLLDLFEIIEVPEKYSVISFLKQYGIYLDIDSANAVESLITEEGKFFKKKIKVQAKNEVDLQEFNYEVPISSYTENENTYIDNSFKYYNQLDKYGKIIYDKLNQNLENMKTGIYEIDYGDIFNDLLHQENGETILNNDFQLAINALNFDNPELFYLDISKIYLITTITNKLFTGNKYSVKIGPNDGNSYVNSSFISKTGVDYAIQNVEEKKQIIENSVSGSVERQIKTVHDYLINNVEYDKSTSADNVYNIYGALVNGYSVCEGYARAFKAIMDDLNIPCIIVCGTATNSNNETENHAWNYVMIEDNWYAIDVTWDDPVIVGNGYISPTVHYKNYLKGSKKFFMNHIEDGKIIDNFSFTYPTLSENDY